MILVFGRCGLGSKVEKFVRELEFKGFFLDVVIYNLVLNVFVREGNIEKIGEICIEMVKRGFVKDEMIYNIIIYMYGK